MRILIAYDGSDCADRAIDRAASLIPSAWAEVLHVWEPVPSTAAMGAVYLPGFGDRPEIVTWRQQEASRVAMRGAERAEGAGFSVHKCTVRAAAVRWEAIVDHIALRRPDLTVMGTRGRPGVCGALTRSVSRAVVSHVCSPVLVIPLALDVA